MTQGKPHYFRPDLTTQEGCRRVDVCIYGATAAGIAAAVQLSRMGHSVLLLEPGGHIGGMTTGGLSRTDSGRKAYVGGLSREFYRDCGLHYGVEEEWLFEPHVASAVFARWLERYQIEVLTYQYLQGVGKEGDRIRSLALQSGLRVEARMFMDCTYEGDLMAAAGASFFVGREGNALYDERYNGPFISEGHHQFHLPMDPYVRPGDPQSGLLPGIDTDPIENAINGDKRIQAYNFRLCLTREPSNRIAFEQPDGYDALEYELLARYFARGWEHPLTRFDPIRGNKVDMNNYGPVSTDFIGRNYGWPEGSYAQREAIFQAHVTYQKGFLWFLCNDDRVPSLSRERMQGWGLAADEFTQTGGWPSQLYVREARRLVGDMVMNENHCLGAHRVEDPIGVGSYQMDSHNCRRIIHNGTVVNEGDVQQRSRTYGIAYRSIVPARRDALANLLVPVCLSASHIAYGSIRMEPVFMILGHSAATAAALALHDGCAVQDVAYHRLRQKLEDEGQVLSTDPLPASA